MKTRRIEVWCRPLSGRTCRAWFYCHLSHMSASHLSESSSPLAPIANLRGAFIRKHGSRTLYINNSSCLSRRPNSRPPDSPYLRHSQIAEVARLCRPAEIPAPTLMQRASERGEVKLWRRQFFCGLSVHNFSGQAVLSEAGVRSMKLVRSGDPKWPRQCANHPITTRLLFCSSTQIPLK